MTVAIILNITLWVVTLLGFVIYNLYRKNVKLEEVIEERNKVIESQNKTLDNLSLTIKDSDKILQEVDKLGAFKSDDEIGFFFQTVKQIQETLNQYINAR